MKRNNYQILSEWRERPETASDVGEKYLRTLDALQRVDPIFSDWGTATETDWETGDARAYRVPVDHVRADVTTFVEANVRLNDWGEPNPVDGYWLWAANHFHEGPSRNDRSMQLVLHTGSEWDNDYSLQAGLETTPPDPSIITYPLFKAALLTLVSIWPAPWANVRCSIWGEKPPTLPGEPPFPYSGFQMPWMAYLNAERAVNLTPPHDILTERTPDGGLLMIAAETRFDPTNHEHMKRSRIIAEIMIERGNVR